MRVMQADPQVRVLEQRAKEAKLNMAAVLRAAGVSPSTWFRWCNRGLIPNLGTLRKVELAINDAVNEAAPRQDAAA